MGRVCRVVPKQWNKYEPVGSVIPNTRFLVFKTPLSGSLAKKVPKAKRFDVPQLMRIVAERGLTLGLVIDLTDTERYYDHGDVEGMCVDYEKVNCPGRGFVERDDLVKTFNALVDSFISSNPETESVIGVHCTHGVNRSGYLVCRFLIDRLGWSSHDAIDAFERARGYPIERGAYVQALHRAAKERKNKKRHRHSEEQESSDESEVQRQLRKRGKHKRKHRSENLSGDENGEQDMDAVWSQMAAVLEQHQSLVSDELTGDNVAAASVEGSPFVGSTGTGEALDDDDDDGEYSGEQENNGDEGEREVSKSSKRRARRQRLHKEFELMKTGNFWKINEMQKDKFK